MKIHHLRQICWQWSLLQCARQGELEIIPEIEDQERQSVLLIEACCRFCPIRLAIVNDTFHTVLRKKRWGDSGVEHRAKRTVQKVARLIWLFKMLMSQLGIYVMT